MADTLPPKPDNTSESLADSYRYYQNSNGKSGEMAILRPKPEIFIYGNVVLMQSLGDTWLYRECTFSNETSSKSPDFLLVVV